MASSATFLLLVVNASSMELTNISRFSQNVHIRSFGFTPQGHASRLYTLRNARGTELDVTDYGATVTSFRISDGTGRVRDIVLGFDDVADYAASFRLPAAPYMGAIVGRYAGRIAFGEFEWEGHRVRLSRNNNGHCLHGGKKGWSGRIWSLVSFHDGDNPSIRLQHVSLDGDMGFPGEVTVNVTYTLTEQDEFIIEYEATSDADTFVNLTHHSYFNLDGHTGDVRQQQMMVNSTRKLEADEENIPTGRILKLDHCPFDFTSPKNCPEAIDTTFVLDDPSRPAATLFSPESQLQLLVYTDQPGVHIYVGGNCFGLLAGKEKAGYHPHSGICFETQHFPDAPNHPHFPSTVLRKDERYFQKTIYKIQPL